MVLELAKTEPGSVWIQLAHIYIVTAGPIDTSASENEKLLLLLVVGDG